MALNLLKRASPEVPNYQVLERLGEGGMSTVYKGRHRQTGQVVAIKVLKEKSAKDMERFLRFQQEYQGAARLFHPNIVQVLDFHGGSSGAYLVMEFVDGPNLEERISQDGPLAQDDALGLITQVAQALHYAHGRKVIHRDVKPQNVLLKSNGIAKLTDFGLMKDVVTDLNLTDPLSVLGTPHFMAPEQYEDARKVDERSDVYSLAATLYCALTGRLPFAARSTIEVLAKQARNDLVPPRHWVPELSPHVEQAVVRAMHSEPSRRPETVLEFVKTLQPREQPDRQRPPAGPEEADRRTAARYGCVLATAFAIQDSLHDDTDSVESWPATVQDVSPGGLSMVLSRRFEPGTRLTVRLRCGPEAAPASVEARVVHVREHGAGQWQLGCRFARQLTEEELRGLE
jgi:serine/threonine protein kinase